MVTTSLIKKVGASAVCVLFVLGTVGCDDLAKVASQLGGTLGSTVAQSMGGPASDYTGDLIDDYADTYAEDDDCGYNEWPEETWDSWDTWDSVEVTHVESWSADWGGW